MSAEQTQEIWQVDANGKVYDTSFAEMTSWIDQGALLRQDKVRKGNLRWIEAGKVPSLIAVFNSKDNGQPMPPPVVTTTKLGPTSIPGDSAANPPNFNKASVTAHDPAPAASDQAFESVCSVHADTPAVFVCGTCSSLFCRACPNSYGGTVKICPFCGAMCSPLVQVEKQREESVYRSVSIDSGFGLADFGAALAYPFKFKVSLLFGALMFMFFTFGQSAVSFGGIFMLGGSIFSGMLGNTLTFGILANTVENFTQGKIGQNFMPGFDDFSVWDDVFHPFFLSIGVYIASFGPFLAVALFAFFMILSNTGAPMNGLQSDAARTVTPELPYAANAAQQSETIKGLINRQADAQKDRVAAINSGNVPADSTANRPAVKDASEMNVERVNQMIQGQRKAQLESAIGKTPETMAKERAEMIKKIIGYGVIYLLVAGICLLWGLFYFPAACTVAAYTRSFAATLNPAVGIDTIRRLGLSYVKILLMGLVLVIVSVLVSAVLGAVFSAFDMPGIGNIPAKVIGSLFGFYLSVVFSCIIGFALFKAADRLKLPGT